tara:strand:- start:1070 stop:2242 length:1173 start_codon:yes stop_codon:yes gene_type:complete
MIMDKLYKNDPIVLSQALIRCKSVTPNDGGALDLLQNILESMGFKCTRLIFTEPGTQEVQNLYARWGNKNPNFCYAGHLDVVSEGDVENWNYDPFAGIIDGDFLYGRGASDMKSAIAAFVSAAYNFIEDEKKNFFGSISFLITCDEEGPAINGTKKVVEWLKNQHEKIDVCLVGEPTNPTKLGEMIKIGRRGSLTGHLTINGQQGHVAYPDLAHNPLKDMIKILNELQFSTLDNGNKFFQPSNLEVISVDAVNHVNNLIPNTARSSFNIRFNNEHTSQSLKQWLHKICKNISKNYELKLEISGEAFITPPEKLSNIIKEAIKENINIEPKFSTTGGTSDARFIRDIAPVAEFGLVGKTMHKIDEKIALSDIKMLKKIYLSILKNYFLKNK